MNDKIISFLGITAIIFGCCYIYHEVYPHVAGQVLITFYSDIKMIMSGRVPDGYSITQEQSARMDQFLFLTYVIKIFLALMFSALGTMGILQFLKRIKGYKHKIEGET
jgi:ABC-type glycerol-3-phosphate transport system permease component